MRTFTGMFSFEGKTKTKMSVLNGCRVWLKVFEYVKVTVMKKVWKSSKTIWTIESHLLAHFCGWKVVMNIIKIYIIIKV